MYVRYTKDRCTLKWNHCFIYINVLDLWLFLLCLTQKLFKRQTDCTIILTAQITIFLFKINFCKLWQSISTTTCFNRSHLWNEIAQYKILSFRRINGDSHWSRITVACFIQYIIQINLLGRGPGRLPSAGSFL